MAASRTNGAKGTATTANPTASFGFTATGGRLLVLTVTGDDYNSGNPSGYTLSPGCEQEGYAGDYVWWRVAAGGETSVQYALGSAVRSSWTIEEWSGLEAAPYDTSAGQYGNTGFYDYSTPVITPTTGERLLLARIFGMAPTDDLTGVASWTSSFAESDEQLNNGANPRQVIGAAYLAATGNGSTTFSTNATFSGGIPPAQHAAGIILSFKVAAGGAGQDLAGAASGAASATGGLTHVVPVAGSASAAATGTAEPSVGKPLAGPAVGQATGSGSLGQGVGIAGAATGQASASADLNHGVALAGAAQGQGAGAGDLSHGVPLSGAAAGIAGAAASLSADRIVPAVESFGRRPRPGRGPYSVGRFFRPRSDSFTALIYADLSGVAAANASAAAALSMLVPLAGASISQAGATGALAVSSSLGGSATGQASASGSVNLGVALTGAAVGTGSATAVLTHGVPLNGSAVALASGSGQIALSIALQGAALSQASAGASFVGSVGLSGTAAVQAGVVGALSLSVPLAGAAQAIASASGGLVITVLLDGAAMATAVASGSLSIPVMLSGSAVGEATAEAILAGTVIWRQVLRRSAVATLRIQRKAEVTTTIRRTAPANLEEIS